MLSSSCFRILSPELSAAAVLETAIKGRIKLAEFFPKKSEVAKISEPARMFFSEHLERSWARKISTGSFQFF